MSLKEIITALSGLNWCGLKLALRRSPDFRAYLSETLRRYDEYAGKGLPPKDPVTWLGAELGAEADAGERLNLPARVTDGGGTSLGELTTLAAVTRLLQPKRVFEIGTFNGRTTSVFLMNTPADALVHSLDLPPEPGKAADMIDSDVYLIGRRRLAAYVFEYQLEDRFRQVLCDSMKFDPEPYRDSIELGFVDGAHAQAYVKNDTEKMAAMMSERGLVFWHDYGGKGRFRPLTEYLEELGRRIEMYRVPGTTLAWTTAREIRKLRGSA